MGTAGTSGTSGTAGKASTAGTASLFHSVYTYNFHCVQICCLYNCLLNCLLYYVLNIGLHIDCYRIGIGILSAIGRQSLCDGGSAVMQLLSLLPHTLDMTEGSRPKTTRVLLRIAWATL